MTRTPDDDARDLLARAIPRAPAPDNWAAQVRARARRGRLSAGLLALALILAIPTGIFVLSRDGGNPPNPGAGVPPAFVGPGTEVWGNSTVFQSGNEPMICFMMLESYPPQCSGPTLRGEFLWEDIAHENASGIRWSSEYLRVQGTFDPADGEYGSLTLTSPITEADLGDSGEVDFPQLCTDPLRGADPTLTSEEAEIAFHDALEGLEVVDVWVSNGIDAYNVVIRGDAEDAHAVLREVWGGELCVQSAGTAGFVEATQEERMAVVEKIFAALPPGQMQAGGPSGTDGTISLNLLYLDSAAYDAIREAAAGIPVELSTLLTPLGAATSVVIE